MSEEEKLQLENECLLKYSKAQMIQKYIDELEENGVLSNLWCKSQEENKRLNENNQAMQEELCKVWGERDNVYRRILDAVDNLETPYFRDCEQQCKDVINILKGSDKE